MVSSYEIIGKNQCFIKLETLLYSIEVNERQNEKHLAIIWIGLIAGHSLEIVWQNKEIYPTKYGNKS